MENKSVSMKKFVFDTADTENVTKLNVGEWSLNLNHQISCSKVVISNIIIPHTFYNINSTNNRIDIYFDDGSEEIYYLPEEHMTYNDITERSELEHFKISFNRKTFKFTFECDYASITHVKFTTSYKIFGFEKDKMYEIPENFILKAPFVADLNSIPAIYIKCNQFHTKFIYNNNRTSIVHRIPVDKPFGQLLTYQNNNTDIYFQQDNIGYLHFTLTDNKGNEINLNNADWKLELLLLD